MINGSGLSPLILIPLILTGAMAIGFLQQPSTTNVGGLNLPEAEAVDDYPESWIYQIGANVGTVSSSMKFMFDGASPLVVEADSSLVRITNVLSQSFILSPDKTSRLESMQYIVNYDVDDGLTVVEVSAKMMIMACPAYEYCDEQGSPNAVILCGDTDSPCDIRFNNASPFITLDLQKWFHKDSPDRLFVDEDEPGGHALEEVRILVHTYYVSVKLQGKNDGALYMATNDNLMGYANFPTDAKLSHSQNIQIGLNQGSIEVQNLMDNPVLEVNDVVMLGNGVAGIVNMIKICTGLSPEAPGPGPRYADGNGCTKGMCIYNYSNDISGSVRECP